MGFGKGGRTKRNVVCKTKSKRQRNNIAEAAAAFLAAEADATTKAESSNAMGKSPSHKLV